MFTVLETPEIRHLLELLADEMSRKEGKSFGYADDPMIAKLQGKLSVLLEVQNRRAQDPLVGPRT